MLLVSLCACHLMCVDCFTYYGEQLGSLQNTQHDVKGDLYVVDQFRLRYVGFSYDGQGPDAFFYVGQKGSKPSEENGRKIPNEIGSESVLRKYDNENIVLALPSNLPVSSLKWFSVWCRQFRVDFGSLVLSELPTNIPAPVELGSLRERTHGVKSGKITLLDQRRIHIMGLHYDGLGPDAFFWGSMTDQLDSNGFIIPNEHGSTRVLSGYKGEDVTITLPEGKTWGADSVRSFGLYCRRYTENFGDVQTNGNYLLPPYFKEVGMGVLANCEVMNEHLNVAWEVIEDHLVVEMMGSIDGKDGYMSFGVSGDDNAVTMVGGDVAVVSFTKDGSAKVEDYFLQSKAFCSGSTGVCPDNNHYELVNYWRMNGVSTVRYKRPLITVDAQDDRDIVPNQEHFFIWALGNLNSEGFVTKHTEKGGLKLHLNRDAKRSCEAVTKVDTAYVVGWNNEVIRADKTLVIDVTIGPTGGKKGYAAITGSQSWGIALYLNGILIPTLMVKRGITVTFNVKTGNNMDNTAEYHPFYITDDRIGGYGGKSQAEKDDVKVLAGPTEGPFCEYKHSANTMEPEVYNTFQEYASTLELDCAEGTPGTLEWTPGADTPDTVYYQCYTHQYLGWQIKVVDEYEQKKEEKEHLKGCASSVIHQHHLIIFVPALAALYLTL